MMNRTDLKQVIFEVIKDFDWESFGFSNVNQAINDEWAEELAYDITERVQE